jgi:hypothetical protein
LRISRRALLLGAGLFAATGGGMVVWWRLQAPSAPDIAGLLHRRLGHLNLDADGVREFAEEYVRRYGASAMRAYSQETFDGVLSMEGEVPPERLQRLLRFERRLVSYYLRSTDHFRREPGRLVRYVAFADPYEVPCGNPFAVRT